MKMNGFTPFIFFCILSTQKQNIKTHTYNTNNIGVTMSHKIILFTLLISNLVLANIKLDFDLTLDKQGYSHHITQELILENKQKIVLNCDDLIITVHVQEANTSNGVCVQTDIVERNSNEYIAQPVLLAEWNKPATVAIGAKHNDKKIEELKLVVKASQGQ